MTKICKTPIKWIALGTCTVLMSGCSWLPFGGGKAHHGQAHGGQYGVQKHASYGGGNCQVPHAQAPIPMGCDPAAVTIGTHGFSQQPSFGAGYGAGAANPYAASKVAQAPQSTTGSYGSHAAHGGGVNYGRSVAAGKPQLRKPRWRGQFSLGVEKSVAGSYLDYADYPGIDPENFYDVTPFEEGSSQVDNGNTVANIYSADIERALKPSIANDDVHSTPMSIKAGAEYILTPRSTVFASAGYTYAEGNEGQAVRLDGRLLNREVVTDDMGNVLTDNTRFIPNVENIASFSYDFNDMRRIDLEVGGRHYLNSLKRAGLNKVTPFVAASVGASHHNSQGFDITQRQAFLQQSFLEGEVGDNTYEVIPSQYPTGRVDLYDSQWVPRGALNAGVEWQATPKTAVAFETGINVQGAREYTNGEKGDANVSIPFTIRGSYNF